MPARLGVSQLQDHVKHAQKNQVTSSKAGGGGGGRRGGVGQRNVEEEEEEEAAAAGGLMTPGWGQTGRAGLEGRGGRRPADLAR